MSADTIDISALDLRKGMTVYRQARGGQWKIDFRIGDPFTTSGPDRLQPLAFHTTNGIKVFAHCTTVVIGTGREAKNTADAAKVIGNQQRRNAKGRRKNRKAEVR
jgi:hypothetical protein